MLYTLMHKNNPVATVNLNDNGELTKLVTAERLDLFPFGVPKKNPSQESDCLKEWYNSRMIPPFRDGLNTGLKNLKVDTPSELIPLSYGVSMTDLYWLRRATSEISWDAVNVRINRFSPDMGNAFFGLKTDTPDYYSPDPSTDGFLKKRWTQQDGKTVLMKEETGRYQQEPFSEKVVSDLLEELKIPHIPYDIVWRDNTPYSICESFVPENAEYIPAWYVMQVTKQPNNRNAFQHFCDCCELAGVPLFEEQLSQMLTIDYIVSNVDRHLGNFGFLSDGDSLEIFAPNPLFDHGNSLFFDKETDSISPSTSVPSRPFGTSRHEQIDLITDFSWLNFSSLSRIRDIIRDNGQEYVQHGLMDDHRLDVIADATAGKIQHLEHKAVGITTDLYEKEKNTRYEPSDQTERKPDREDR